MEHSNQILAEITVQGSHKAKLFCIVKHTKLYTQ